MGSGGGASLLLDEADNKGTGSRGFSGIRASGSTASGSNAPCPYEREVKDKEKEVKQQGKVRE